MKKDLNRSLWLKWTIYCALGELIGIGIAASIAFGVNIIFSEPQTLQLKLLILFFMLLAGFIEGFLLGTFQWKALKDKIPLVPKNEWIFYTVLVAVLGWLIGMLPSLFFIPQSESVSSEFSMNFDDTFLFAMISIGAGLVLGAIFGLFQWFVLRKYTLKPYRWIIANSLGWAVGLGWIYLFASLPNEDSNIIINVVYGIIGGFLAGLSVGGITGLFLIRFQEK